MKLMFISDIHGSLHWLEQALAKAEEEQPHTLVVLGDFLYHGPRNPLPDGYDPQGVAAKLNAYGKSLVAVRGNCDAEVDQMLLQFPMMGDYVLILHEGRKIYATHGHGFSIDNLPPLAPGDVFIQGHTHLPVAEVREGITVLNPGSISLPKENNPNSYAILENGEFIIKDFAGKIVKQIQL
ncbi:phosphodiesterase [Paenibacillus graminis]|uniref:Phosphoesterase n=1 Tax=Paenibacillus graminis TaxID=189425 RepID=A0A089M4Z2_9BACL|nr:phosphodiesterase [Paenibacillus graminis]AIQ66568.1 phosphodiesterase [Paenibacillus graminis]MEC0172458.1 phosphodiesterase [Paenibacillus graminis]